MTLLQVSPDIPQALLATTLVRASLVLAGSWLLTFALRRAAAATRHAVWTAALASLVLLPVAAFLLPRWEARPLPAAEPAMMPAVAAPTSSAHALAASAAVEPASASHDHGFMQDAPVSRPSVLISLLVVVWGLGAAFGLGRLSASLAAARRLVRRAHEIKGAGAAARDLAARLGIGRDVRVLLAEGVSVPVNCGLWSPVILLPAASRAWSEDRLRVVLLHELAHVRRWDYASLIAIETARALYWINPLVWIAARRANMELERACDDEVLRAGTRSVDYAEHLYAIAASLPSRAPAGALAMAAPSTLGSRVRAILAASMNRAPVRARAKVAVAVLVLTIGVPLASLRLLGEGREAANARRAIAGLSAAAAAERSHGAFQLGTMKAGEARGSLLIALSDADPGVRGMAAWALGRIGGRAVGPALRQMLSDPEPDVREQALLGLSQLGDRSAVSSAARLADDSAMGVRGVLTHTLMVLGGAEARATLERMVLRDRDTHVRDMASYALRYSAGRDAVPTLILALKDPEPEVRGDAARNLAELADGRALPALAEAARTDRAPMVRGASSWALGQLKDARAAEPLAVAMRDSVWNVRVAAAGALGRTPGPVAEAALIAATRDPVHQVRLTAMSALTARAN